MRSLSDCSVELLRGELRARGIAESHAQRVLREYLRGEVPAGPGTKLRRLMEEELAGERSRVIRRQVSGDGTVKLLLGMESGGTAESVLMLGFRPERASGCVSSQVGCAMGCDFCASTKGGLERNLEVGEIVEQFRHLRIESQRLGRRLGTIVFMGMGEPLANLENVIPAVKMIADPALGGLGWRHVTVSTVGIVPAMDALAEADLGVHLALSLHAADDETRSRIVPMNRRYPIKEILAAADRFQSKSGRIPTIEWCLLEGINDSVEQAHRLCELLNGRRFHVNLIPYNAIGLSVRGMTYRAPNEPRMDEFIRKLREAGLVAHFRHTRGRDVDAACGQLRAVHAGL